MENSIESHVCLHPQSFYGNTFLWVFNYHKGLLRTPLSPRKATKVGDGTVDYSIKENNYNNFHLRPDDFHKWDCEELTWEQHINNVTEEMHRVNWREKIEFNKLLVKPYRHQLHILQDSGVFLKINPTAIYSLSVDPDNIDFLKKLAKRREKLNNEDSTANNHYKDLLYLANLTAEREEILKQTHNVCSVDICKLLFEYDDNEYNKVLQYLNVEPLPFWKTLVYRSMEIIGEI